MKFSTTISLFAPALLATFVSAHGVLTRAKVGNSKTFSVNDGDSIIRKVSSQDPNKGANNPALTCGPNASPAPAQANAQPGDVMTFDWRTASDGPWPHNTGPILTYMASCGAASCSQFDPAQAQWFKIDEKGRKNGGDWFQADLMNGATSSATIPQNLAPGNYMVRHEIIALHLATQQGGAEFYPGCIQVKVGGSGTGAPAQNELVRFPGAYKDSDPGIFAPGVFNAASGYTMPGPAISKLAATGGAAPPAAPGPDAPTPSGTAAPGKPSSAPGNGAPKPPAGSPPAGAPAPGPTAGSDSGAGSGACRNHNHKNQRRNVSRQPSPVDDVADEFPEVDSDEVESAIDALRKALTASIKREVASGVQRRHINSRIARRMSNLH